MISFLFRGIRRDSQRSRLPIIIIASGVMLTVVLSAFMAGVLGDVVDLSAKFTTSPNTPAIKALSTTVNITPLAMIMIGRRLRWLSLRMPLNRNEIIVVCL